MDFRRRDDFGVEPWRYPGEPVPHSGLMTDDSYRPLPDPGSLDRTLTGLGVAPVVRRHTVLAVGSNASRSVMWRKFTTRKASPVVPFLQAAVRGLRPGHSAHISIRGFIPAAPVFDLDARSGLVVSLLDDEQLAALDATEPNYQRLRLDPRSCPVELEDGTSLEDVWVYVSEHGTLAQPGETSLPLLPQEKLFSLLRQECDQIVSLLPDDPHSAMKSLAASADLRTSVVEALRAAGCIRPANYLR